MSRWQYVIVNIGSFGAAERMTRALSFLGEHGYELVTVYDKASNWFQGYEKGFMLFKRAVPADGLPDGPWCGLLDVASLRITTPTVMPDEGQPW